MSVCATDWRAGPAAVLRRHALTDYIAGLYAVIANAGQLRARSISGKGQSVDVSLIESAFSFMESFVIFAYARKG